MPEHTHIGCCSLVAALVLVAVASAHAAPKDTAGKDDSPAITLAKLGGTWKNTKSGVNIRIEQGAGGWEVWFSTSGEARITLPEKNRPAIKIDGRNFTCSYSVTLPTAQTMKWDLTKGQPEAQCLTGVFTRLEPAPSDAKRAAPAAPEAKQAVKGETPPEAKKPPQVETWRKSAPASRATRAIRRFVAPARIMPRHAATYRRPPARAAMHHRGWRVAAAPRPYAASRYRPYRFYHYRYRWYVVLVPRCGCY
jgi:hypothetical protein